MAEIPSGMVESVTTIPAEQKLLEAGHRLLGDGVPLTQLKLGELTEAAGVSNGAFYHFWPDGMLAYRRDLARYSLAPEQSPYLATMMEAVGAAGPETVTLEVLCREYGAFDSSEMDRDSAFNAQVSMWPLRRTVDGVVEALQDSYSRHTDDVYAPAYQQLIDRYGFRLRPPFDARRLAVSITALVEGMAFRRAVDPEAVALPAEYVEEGWEIVGMLIYALLGSLLVADDSRDARTVTEFVTEALATARSGGSAGTDALRAEAQGSLRRIENEVAHLSSIIGTDD